MFCIKVYIAARSEEKMAAALERLESDDTGPGNGEVQSLKLDLSDPREAKAVAQEFLDLEDRLDILSMSR
jgi:NAD(P)-dependent dehydrogenase (short-subunit alcohol dehydrogenase family)